MAERRMFSKTIVDSDVFLDMPASTQNLYFHLNIRADDEGFIDSPKKIMRGIGANQNDLEILLSKRYVLSFESGVVVIKHWKLHNAIRKDRMKDTLYQEEKAQLFEKKNGSYTDRPQIGNQAATKEPHRLGKVRLGEVSIGKESKEKPKKHKHGEYKNVLLSDSEFEKIGTRFGEAERKGMISRLDEGIELKGYKYKSHYLALLKWNKKDEGKVKNNGMGVMNFEL